MRLRVFGVICVLYAVYVLFGPTPPSRITYPDLPPAKPPVVRVAPNYDGAEPPGPPVWHCDSEIIRLLSEVDDRRIWPCYYLFAGTPQGFDMLIGDR